MMTGTGQVIVIGGGITGLVCAYRLRQSGARVLLLEASNVAGGMIATIEKNGFLFEAGPQVPRFPVALWQLVIELGLQPDFVPGDARAARYILKNGRLHRAPLSPSTFLATRLIGAGSKMRLLAEPLRSSQAPPGEESLADFVRRKFDADVLDYVVEPFISAVFAGDAEKMGVASAFPFLERWDREGSLLGGAIRSRKQKIAAGADGESARRTSHAGSMGVTDSLPSLGNFRSGLAVIPQKIAEKLGDSLRVQSAVDKIEQMEGEAGGRFGWRVRLRSGEQLEAGHIVIAAPAYEAARLLANAAPELSKTLAKISYAPMAVVSSGYNRAQVRHPLNGFGVLIPRREKLNTIFQVWNSSLLPGRAPAGKVLLTSYAGGATNPNFIEKDDDEIARIVESEMGNLLGIEGTPTEQVIWKHSRALPQYNIGQARTIAEVRKSVGALRGVHLAGDYFEGRSLGDCVEMGTKVADEVESQRMDAAYEPPLERVSK